MSVYAKLAGLSGKDSAEPVFFEVAMVQKYIPEETNRDIYKCFYSKREFTDFVEFLESFAEEVSFLRMLRFRGFTPDGKHDKVYNKEIMIRELCFMCMFLNQNFDLVQQVLSVYRDHEVNFDQGSD